MDAFTFIEINLRGMAEKELFVDFFFNALIHFDNISCYNMPRADCCTEFRRMKMKTV